MVQSTFKKSFSCFYFSRSVCRHPFSFDGQTRFYPRPIWVSIACTNIRHDSALILRLRFSFAWLFMRAKSSKWFATIWTLHHFRFMSLMISNNLCLVCSLSVRRHMMGPSLTWRDKSKFCDTIFISCSLLTFFVLVTGILPHNKHRHLIFIIDYWFYWFTTALSLVCYCAVCSLFLFLIPG